MPRKYDTIKIPEELTAMVDQLIKIDSYTSRTDAIKYAVRQLYERTVERLDKEKQLKKITYSPH